jgi:nicotinamidase-related amidase
MHKNTALLVIDLQVEMFSDTQNPLYKVNELLNKAMSLVKKAHTLNVPLIIIHIEPFE